MLIKYKDQYSFAKTCILILSMILKCMHIFLLYEIFSYANIMYAYYRKYKNAVLALAKIHLEK